jgi:ribonuclease BN (tRNA processing enzyme)
MEVNFIGCGDAWGSGGRFNTCFLLAGARCRILVDCGASSLVALKRAGIAPNAIDGVVLSHLHGDHFGGLPFLLLDAQFYSRRNAPLTLVGPPGFRERLTQAMEVFFPGSSRVQRKFATEIVEIEAGTTSAINGVDVTAHLVAHACGAPPLALRLSCERKVIAYTGDTEWTETLLELGRDADLLIAEALFFARKIKHHLDYATLKANLVRIGAKRVVLTHMGPEMLEHRADVPEDVAEDGKIIRL